MAQDPAYPVGPNHLVLREPYPDRSVSQPLARFLVFFTSAAVLVIEILAVRLLAPYLGVSLGVFTGVIGVILAGISVGAWLGGRAADRIDPTLLIGPALTAGGITAMLSPLIVDWIGPSLSNDAISTVIVATAGFFVPAAILSTIPPLIVKIRLASLAQTGAVVGSYSAIGTAGAIFGVFITGFFLVANFPTRPIVAVVGGLLVVGGIILGVRRTKAQTGTTLAFLVFLALFLTLNPGPCQFETTYHCAIVVADDNPPTGRTLILDRLHNSYVDIADPTYLRFRYIELIADILEATVRSGPIHMVSIGGGGMTLPGYLEATRPGSRNTALEIDGGVVEIARTHLDLSDRVTVVVDDARISLRHLGDASVDFVVGDAFSGASVPWHLTTIEYLTDIQRVLTEDGIYAMNVIDFAGLNFVRSTAATLAARFEYVALFAPPSYLDGSAGGNFVFAASSQPIDLLAIQNTIGSRGGIEIALSGAELSDFAEGALILRDDFAPVDQMLGTARRQRQ